MKLIFLDEWLKTCNVSDEVIRRYCDKWFTEDGKLKDDPSNNERKDE